MVWGLLVGAGLAGAQSPGRSPEPNPDKCGFPEVWRQWQQAGDQALADFARSRQLAEQAGSELYVSPSGHFQIQFDPQQVPDYDRNGDGVPDFVELAGLAFDRAWTVEIDSLGFRPPPEPDGGVRDPYPVQITPLGSTYGITFLDEEIPGKPGLNFSSFIQVNSNFGFVWWYPDRVSDPIQRDSMALAVTAAHEFNHALQLGYRIWNTSQDSANLVLQDLWFIESSATFMEEFVADEVNDYYQYLPAIYGRTDRSLISNLTSNRLYGGSLFDILLSEVYGPVFLRQIWEQIEQEPAVHAMETELEQQGSSLEEELTRLAVWMYFSGSRAIPGRFFPEAENYPTLNVQELGIPPRDAPSVLTSSLLPPLSFLIVHTVLEPGFSAVFRLEPNDQAEHWSGSLISDQSDLLKFPANFNYRLPDVPLPNPVPLAIISGFWSDNGGSASIAFNLSGQSVSAVQGPDILVYPNPLRPADQVQQIAFLNLPPGARIDILTASGKHLCQLAPG
ncbi:MAG: hypothetical protein D6715_04550, partial [Calditrichaeota bacterium]